MPTIARDLALADEVTRMHGLRPGRIEEIVGNGFTNHVFLVHGDRQRYVVRFPIDPLRDNSFETEAWALARAAEQGIPSPIPVGWGTTRGVPYLIQTFVDGVPGSSAPSVELWRVLGEYSNAISTIALTSAPDGLFTRFGRDLMGAWTSHLDYNRRQLVPADPLIELGVYTSAQQPLLREFVGGLTDLDLHFGLCHGDLAPRNLLVADGVAPVLIDWGSASAGPVPFGDLLHLVKAHRSDGSPSTDELAAFADGAGIALGSVMGTVEDLLLLSALDLPRWALDRRPDRLAEIVAASKDLVQSRWSD
ncbi:Ser/Thr protein kinase RdoA (MazF antagonist) [Nakamurella sp. UYEF19]|uniref:aminoglycoside phosphotransferase family protein n=1 Tax=Nakamurella sp. UYEF19 TaxID=1756392 RepID=UPI003399B92C